MQTSIQYLSVLPVGSKTTKEIDKQQLLLILEILSQS